MAKKLRTPVIDKRLKVLVLEGSRWARGGKNGNSLLLNEKGGMCCLGFLAKSLGASDGQLRKKAMPYDTNGDTHGPPQGAKGGYWSNLASVPWPKLLLGSLAGDIAVINDEKFRKDANFERLSDAERFELLQPKFARVGYRLVLKP